MPSFAATFEQSLGQLLRVAAEVSSASGEARGLTDDELMDSQRALAEARRHVDASAAMLAGEVLRRSHREAGLDGLARKQGYRTAQALVQGLTGGTAKEANALIRVGSMLNDLAVNAEEQTEGDLDGAGQPSPPAEPWLAAVAEAVAAGTLSVAGADAIRIGLGRPGPGVTTDQLGAACVDLVASLGEANGVDADRILRLARDARDELDTAGITEREQQQRSLRSFTRWRRPDGITRYSWDLHPEDAALVDEVYDKITSPRRGGPRFLDPTQRARAEAIEHDPRTTEQLASDAFLDLLHLALSADASTIVGINQPAVRVLVAAQDLETGIGRGWIEGQPDPISLSTVERYACRNGIEQITFDNHHQPINLGRTQRTYTRTQRRLLAARDGGCRWPGCARPPEWTEAHHIRWWNRDHGPTDIDNGILLCRHHHLLLHDNGWEIRVTDTHGSTATGPDYWLVPPPDIDPTRQPRPMPSKSRALIDAHREYREHQDHRQPVPA